MKKKIFIKNSLILLFALFSTMVFAKKSNKIEPILIKSPGSFRFDLPESDKAEFIELNFSMEDALELTSK